MPAAILLCLGVGTLCGLLNGLAVVLLGVHPFVITLGTMAIYRGIAFVMTKAQAYTHFPAQFTDGLIRYEVGRNLYPVPMLIMVGLTALAAAYLRYTVGGRHVFAVGGNEQAARLSGLPVERVKVKVYAFSGLTAGIAALIMLGYYGSASSDAGKGYELDVIAAAVVGGASLSGGRGTALGALLGALIIQIIANGIIILEIDQNYSQIIIGAVIVLAVVLDRLNTALHNLRLATAVRIGSNHGWQTRKATRMKSHKHGHSLDCSGRRGGVGRRPDGLPESPPRCPPAAARPLRKPRRPRRKSSSPWWPRTSRTRFSRRLAWGRKTPHAT